MKEITRGVVKKIKINNHRCVGEILTGDGKGIFINVTGYIKYNINTHHQYINEKKLFERLVKKEAYRLAKLIFPGFQGFIFVASLSETSPETCWNVFSHFNLETSLRFDVPQQIKTNDNVEMFCSELLDYISSRYNIQHHPKLVLAETPQGA